ncbi:Phosphoglucosamine mutase [Chaetomidium leptoderma]|uniref:Phosphoglucosamine mutase n=1 Tax=Chaetomidium leptoderma TaxID=669021 RepID=A0AAN6VDK7_9PEZI|nr:Phosphoglucosamine mutase [Chaetomidium leptoderma]
MSSSSPDAATNMTPHDETNMSGSVVVCAVVLPVISTAVVTLRFYVRAKLLRSVKSEDWCILLALLFTIVSAVFVIEETRYALGRHASTVSPADMIGYRKASYFQTLCYNLSLCFTKISILLLYLRVLTHNYIRKVTWAAIGIVGVYNAWGVGMYLIWWALTYLHIITDFMIFVIPIPVVATMTIPMRQKSGLLFVFCLGLFVCLISVLRTILLNQVFDDEDGTWGLVVIANWSTAEINVAIVCGCMPTLRPILSKVFGPLMDRLFPSQHQSLEESTTDDRPRTVGSMPINAFRFGRQSRSGRGSKTPGQLESLSTEAGGTLSMTVVDNNDRSDSRRKDMDSDAELNPGRDDFAVDSGPG